ncbi:MAG: hypothetical protein QOE33_246 [Acidobacteriota bacterium]|nr:hypothetical protein [Acidobacteriota bacterium]
MKGMFSNTRRGLTLLLAISLLLITPGVSLASSHMDAPLITLDDPANTTDVYAFLSTHSGAKYLSTALAVFPFEEPGIGPNAYRFDDNVLYEIHVATGADVAAGRATYSYQFQFTTQFKNTGTILQAYTGVVQNVNDASQNLVQTYTVTRVNHLNNQKEVLGTGVTPPNNQGNATPFYNQGDNGENRAKEGAATDGALDRYTTQSIANLARGYRAFAGQRDDGFYADIQAIFDLLKLRAPGQAQDAQGGFNVHTMALDIPVGDIGGDKQVVGVYATTSRRTVTVRGDDSSNNGNSSRGGFFGNLRKGLDDAAGTNTNGKYVQVARQGNPLFNEALVAIKDKDLYSRTSPTTDSQLFRTYAENPELARLLNALVFHSTVAPETGRTDIAAIFIPDLIKTDLSTAPARLTGANADDAGFSRLGIFGGDVLTSTVQTGFGGGTVPGGWPNGRRFGDDVVDIAVTALASDLRPNPPIIRGPFGDNVDHNDITYNKVFPYAATPLNGRIHNHHGLTTP